LLKIKADLVLATSTPLTIGVPALIKKWFGKTPFVFEVRDVWPVPYYIPIILKEKTFFFHKVSINKIRLCIICSWALNPAQ
jgi:hypothetical protein